MKTHKILVILDDNFGMNAANTRFQNAIKELFNPSYSVDFNYFLSSSTNYEFDSVQCQNKVDEESILVSVLDYECVIVFGTCTYFWLRTYYFGNMIVINPVLDIYNNDYYKDDQLYYDYLHGSREFVQNENTICMISKDFTNNIKKIDNVFSNTTVVSAEEHIKDIETFFSKGSTFDKVFNFLVNH